MASAVVNTTNQVGSSIGVALLSTIAASATSSFLKSHHHGPAAQAVATVHGYATGFIVSAALLGAAGIVCFLLLRNNHIEASEEAEEQIMI